MRPPAASRPACVRSWPRAARAPGPPQAGEKAPRPRTAAPILPRKGQQADANCRKPASDLLDVLQAVPARRDRSGIHPPASPTHKRSAGKQPAADKLAPAPGCGGPRTDASPLRPHGEPNTAAAAGLREPPRPRRTASRDQNPSAYTNWF
jgi:hypothetical protein